MILFLTNADSEILCVRSVVDGLPGEIGPVRCANPVTQPDRPDLAGVRVVVVRLLGGRGAWKEGFDDLRGTCIAAGIPLAAFGGEAVPDGELASLSTVPATVITEGFPYLVHGGPRNMERFLCFLADRVLGSSIGYGPPEEVPLAGVMGAPSAQPGRPTVAVVFYRAQYVAGNVSTVRELCDAIESKGANAVAVYCYSLRDEPGDRAVSLLSSLRPDCLVTTVWAAGSSTESGDGWDVSRLASLDVPVVQAIASTAASAAWEASSIGLGPMDVAMSVAIPEFDGRIVTVPFSFKETVDDGEGIGSPVTAYRAIKDRVERVAAIAVAQARLRSIPTPERRVAIVLSAYPTKRSRIGNAVGLDTPASVLELLGSLAQHRYAIGRGFPDGDALMAELAASMVYDPTLPGPGAVAGEGSLGFEAYRSWFATLPKPVKSRVEEAWGEAPGSLFTDAGTGTLRFAGADVSAEGTGGGVFVAVQPPRGFGENPVAVYHSPDLPPTHHYLAFYRWLTADRKEGGWGCHAIVHVGKHGTLEWLPGKGVGLSAECFPDVALGDTPLVYPFVVNDPGEGAQAKRRAHAVIVDHLVPPMTRADAYDDIARLETLLDEHQRVLSLDPGKLPSIRRQIWDVVVEAEIHRDLGLHDREGRSDFGEDTFDDLVGELDGYLCELKDAQIRGGLHVLGRAPEGDALVDMVLAVTRVPQGGVPSLRQAVATRLGIDLDRPGAAALDRVEGECRRLVSELYRSGWLYRSGGYESGGEAPAPLAATAGSDEDRVLEWIADRLVPALGATAGEIGAVERALDGRFVSPGPSGAPTRGMAHVLPTGRNFYSIDPRAVPSPLSWEVGWSLASELVERYRREEGAPPREVALVVWGTATMRTAGDDVAEALALLGVRPVWDGESARVTGLEVIGPGALGRARVGVTLRISGFFRDAFSHLVALFEEAVALVGSLDEPPEVNPVAVGDREVPTGATAADPRVFGPKPGSYGSGVLPVIESGEWAGDADLAAVYLAWGGFAYRGDGTGFAAPDEVRRRFAAVQVAVKNQDNREHDIFDSDDYLQDHGGLIATVRHLAGVSPRAYFGDSADPEHPRVRTLSEEAARVVRTRVVNPKWIDAMRRHGYKGAFELAATVDYLFGYDATACIAEDWMYEKITEKYVADPGMRDFFRRSNPHALRSIAERLLEAVQRGMWDASDGARSALEAALLESEGWEEASS